MSECSLHCVLACPSLVTCVPVVLLASGSAPLRENKCHAVFLKDSIRCDG